MTEHDTATTDTTAPDVVDTETLEADAVEAAETDPATEADADVSRETSTTDAADRLDREGEVAADFLETLLDIADLDGDIDVDVDGDRASVSIVDSEEGRVPRRLVGPNGKVLDALQELTRLAVQAETGNRSRLMLDVAGFRADRRAELVQMLRRPSLRAGERRTGGAGTDVRLRTQSGARRCSRGRAALGVRRRRATALRGGSSRRPY